MERDGEENDKGTSYLLLSIYSVFTLCRRMLEVKLLGIIVLQCCLVKTCENEARKKTNRDDILLYALVHGFDARRWELLFLSGYYMFCVFC